jgi:exopolyphosphatase/guanosine-5'-triphosphate,3'-diphosphate pyrophosphatase
LVAHHRRKLRTDAKLDVLKVGGNKLLHLCLLLRLAVLLNHSRSDEMLPAIELTVDNAQQWQLSVSGDAKQWPLLVADLHDEQVQFKHWDIELNIQSEQFID